MNQSSLTISPLDETSRCRRRVGDAVTNFNVRVRSRGSSLNESKKISISVTGFSKENNHHIGFEIYGIKNGKNVYGDALIASDIENTFENVVQNVEKIKYRDGKIKQTKG